MGDDNLVELPDGGAADGEAAPVLVVDGVEGRHVVLQDGKQVVRVLTGAGLWDCLGFEALFDKSASLGFVQPVDALDDAGLDGPAAVRRRQARALDVRPLVEPLVAQFIVRGE